MLFLVVLAMIILGAGTQRPDPRDLAFEYRAFGGDDEIDQVLEITNNGEDAVTPTLEITPLDRTGRPIPGVEVSSAYGSELGSRVVPALYTDIDLLHFEGERAGEVRDVRVRVEKVEPVDADVDEVLETARYKGDEKVEEYDEAFDAVELRNPNEDAVEGQIVIIAWDAERGGDPQQWQWVTLAGPPVSVPAKGRRMVPLPDDLAGISTVSMKAYIRKTP